MVLGRGSWWRRKRGWSCTYTFNPTNATLLKSHWIKKVILSLNWGKKIPFVSLSRSTSLIKYLLNIFFHTTRTGFFACRMSRQALYCLQMAVLYTHQTFYEAGFSYIGMHLCVFIFLEKSIWPKKILFSIFLCLKRKKWTVWFLLIISFFKNLITA